MKRRMDATVDLDKLCYLMSRDRWALKRPREERAAAVREYAGAHWSENGADREQPINHLAEYVSIMGRALIANNPRIRLATFDAQNKPAVSAMEDWFNAELVRTRFADMMSRIVLDGLFSIGICKIGLATPVDSALAAWNVSAGKPFCERIDLDDFVVDMHARDWSQVRYIGHRYRAPLALIKGSPLYSKARLRLNATQDAFYNLEGDERISTMGRTFYAQDDDLEDMVDLWEVYLPQHRMLLTLQDDSITGADTSPHPPSKGKERLGGALRVARWIGPESGPIQILKYLVVPGNLMPSAPIQHLVCLNQTINGIYRKNIAQAQRQKTNLVYQRSASEDAQRMLENDDGTAIACDNPALVTVREWGGPNQQNFQFGVHLNEVFNRQAGNLDAIGGLAPQSHTLGQDRMLDQSAAGGVAAMQDITVNFVADVARSMLWYGWHDPYSVNRSRHNLSGLPDIGITRSVTPQERQQTRFEDLELEIDPYSMQHQTPQMVDAALDDVMTKVLIPLMPLLAQQGVRLDLQAYLKKKALLRNMPDLPDIATMGEPPPMPQSGPPGMPTVGRPAETTRNYVRRSLGQGSPANQNNDMMNQLSKNIRVQQGAQKAGQP